MPLYIDELNSEMDVLGEDLVLTDSQLEIIVRKVVARLRRSEDQGTGGPALTGLRTSSQPPIRPRR